MNHHLFAKQARRITRGAALAVATLSLALSAAAQSAFFSGPSVSKVAQPAAFSGKGFAPNSAVTVTITAPGGAAAGVSAITSDSGDFAYTLVPSIAGSYSLAVTDASGRVLATVTVVALP